MKRKKKHKEDKTKELTPMVLTNGDLDQIGFRIQEAAMESWNNLEDRYGALLIGVEERIV